MTAITTSLGSRGRSHAADRALSALTAAAAALILAMLVVLATGNAALFDGSFERSTRTVTATIAQELGEVVVGSPHYHVLFALGALLFLSTLVVNLGAERIVGGMRRRLGGTQ